MIDLSHPPADAIGSDVEAEEGAAPPP